MLKLGIPLALHKENEIEAFSVAKERIQALTARHGYESEVSAFAFLMPRSFLTAEALDQQLELQAKYQVPIIHAEGPVQYAHSLAHDIHAPDNRLLEVLTHVANFQRFTDEKLFLDVHIGAILVDSHEGHAPKPAVYTHEEYAAQETLIRQNIQQNLDYLIKQGKQLGIGIALENVMPVQVKPHPDTDEPHFSYLAASAMADWQEFGREGKTFDTAHWATAQCTQRQFKENGIDPVPLFNLLGVSTWEEYTRAIGDYETHLKQADVIHLANAEGIGNKLDTHSPEAYLWGRDISPQGVLTPEQLRRALDEGNERNIPVILEVPYNLEKISENKFSEADVLLNYVLEGK